MPRKGEIVYFSYFIIFFYELPLSLHPAWSQWTAGQTQPATEQVSERLK